MRVRVDKVRKEVEHISSPRLARLVSEGDTIPGRIVLTVEVTAVVEDEDDYADWEAHLGQTLDVEPPS